MPQTEGWFCTWYWWRNCRSQAKIWGCVKTTRSSMSLFVLPRSKTACWSRKKKLFHVAPKASETRSKPVKHSMIAMAMPGWSTTKAEAARAYAISAGQAGALSGCSCCHTSKIRLAITYLDLGNILCRAAHKICIFCLETPFSLLSRIYSANHSSWVASPQEDQGIWRCSNSFLKSESASRYCWRLRSCRVLS